jgi:hypothetical protein
VTRAFPALPSFGATPACAGAAAFGFLSASSARRFASSSALVGKSLRPAAFFAARAAASAAFFAASASSSALVGKSLRPAAFFATTFFAGAFFATTAFFAATFFAGAAFFAVALAPFLGALVPGTGHPFVYLTHCRVRESCWLYYKLSTG